MLGLGKKDIPSLPAFSLQGRRVIVRPPCADDVDQWISVRTAAQDFLRPLEPAWPVGCLTSEFFQKRLALQTQAWHQDRTYSFLIFMSDDHSLIGGINLNNVCRGAAHFASPGYWLAPARQGHGYMQEALALVIEYGFMALSLHRLNAACLPENQRSLKLLHHLGFQKEGFATRYLEIGGVWRDHVLLGLTAEDWKDPKDHH